MLERGEKNWLIYQLKLEIQKTQNPLQTWGNQGCDSFHCIGVVSIDFFVALKLFVFVQWSIYFQYSAL